MGPDSTPAEILRETCTIAMVGASTCLTLRLPGLPVTWPAGPMLVFVPPAAILGGALEAIEALLENESLGAHRLVPAGHCHEMFLLGVTLAAETSHHLVHPLEFDHVTHARSERHVAQHRGVRDPNGERQRNE